jgi:hypothetical protein
VMPEADRVDALKALRGRNWIVWVSQV